MSTSRKTSSSYVSTKILDFPDNYGDFRDRKPLCSYRAALEKSRPVHPEMIHTSTVLSIKNKMAKTSPQDTSPSILSQAKSTSKKTSSVSTSRKMDDTHHKKSVTARKTEFQQPCPESVILGAPKPFIGNCPLKDIAAKMISSKKLFTLTEDPRKRFCLRNPKVLHYKPLPPRVEQANIREMVKTADNVLTSSGSQSTISSICEVIDLANPLNLDFQGMDYKNTYMQDEQSLQNQMEYRKVRRYKHRRNVKAATVVETEKLQQEERVSIPKHFRVENPIPPELIPPPEERVVTPEAFGSLIRAEAKPEIKERIEQEDADRKERYKQLYLEKKKREAKLEEEKMLNEKEGKGNIAKMLAEKDIADLVQILDRTITTKKMSPRVIPARRDFPHNLSETLRFRHDLKKSKRILRDRGKIKQEFYEEIGKPKRYNVADLEVSSSSRSLTPLSEVHSTNDEDDMEVGQRGSKFLLRGFLYKMGSNLRGKFHQKDITAAEGTVKGCMTREEWFETLVSKRKKIELDEKLEPGMELFPPAKGLQRLRPKSSIREFRKKPLGRHYDRMIRRNLRIKKMKHTKVRKFNLINYLYGIESKRKSLSSLSSVDDVDVQGQTLEYMRSKAKVERAKRRLQKRRRMHYLGIPCPTRDQKRTKSACVDSDSEDSDWIPDDNREEAGAQHLTSRLRGNMPAPENRESTLRCHPRHPRDYKGLRIPSEIFDETVKKSDIPILRKLKEDKYFLENVWQVKNTDFGKRFEARHHHDHWDPTQHKTVHITYARRVIQPKPLDSEERKVQEKLPKTFDKARPRGDIHDEDVDYTLPKLDTDQIIQDFNDRPDAGTKKQAGIKFQPIPKMKDMIYHSLDEDELREFPGREKFIEFLLEIKAEIGKRAGLIVAELAIDKNAYLEELREDLKSIESCLSSLSSSLCTNLTYDSGSFLMAGDQKIPLDYIRKSLVPFEEINRSRFQAVPIDAAKEEEDPFRTVPFAGQEKEQMIAAAPKDSFFTFNTRLQNGKRLRLEVKQKDRREQLLGTNKGVKAPSQVATDIDELYIEDLKNRPSFKPFKWNSCRTMIKDALRKKFESMLIQGEIVRTKIYDRRNDEYFQHMLKMKTILEKLFAKWEKKEYESAMEVVHKVKPYYEATDKYRRESEELGKQFTVLNMDIVYIENDWIRRTILQNFHYLLGEMEWRAAHDWIHRTEDGELEGFEESIAKRNTTNIRRRDKDDAWAIKEFYDNVYLQNYHPITVVFTNTDEFLNGIENLKSKTFVLLQELHYTLWILAELHQKYQEFSDWCTVELESKKTYAENKCANKYFMEGRAKQLKEQVHLYLGRPIETSFSDKRLSMMKGVCAEVYKDVVPPSSQMDVGPLEQVAMISQVLSDLIGRFEGINLETRRRVEQRYRRILGYRRNMSKQAVLIERRIVSEMVKVRRNLAPPFKKPRREGKLPRSELKKFMRVSAPKLIRYSEKTRFFYRAFHEEGELDSLQEAKESLDIMGGIQKSIVPFYFDYFLSVNGYQPNYNFKTQVELRDGPEIERFNVKSLLPDVIEKFEKWQYTQKKIMEENINKNPKMYLNVQI